MKLKTKNDLTTTERTYYITLTFVFLQVVYRTVVHSHATNKRDIRIGNTLNIVLGEERRIQSFGGET